MRYELADLEWSAIKPFLPNTPRGVPRVNDRRVLNGAFWVLRSVAPWRDPPQAFGPYATCYNRFVRWRRAGVGERIMNALASARDAVVARRGQSSPSSERPAFPRNRLPPTLLVVRRREAASKNAPARTGRWRTLIIPRLARFAGGSG